MCCVSAYYADIYYGLGSERNETKRKSFCNDWVECFRENVSILLLGDLHSGVGDEIVKNVVGRHIVFGRKENGENYMLMCRERWWLETPCSKRIFPSMHG